jgi:16S rRNA (adenine(1408)-N(1))-methyltransferase
VADPDAFVLAIDADARSMAETSRRAAARIERGGIANIAFVAEGVERLPSALDGLADVVTVLFPWGSLLRGAMGLDALVASSIARLVAPDGRLEIVLSIVDRDRAAIGGQGAFGPADIDRITSAFGALDLALSDARRLSTEEVAATGSRWARRLRTDTDRPVWHVGFRRATNRSPAEVDAPAATPVRYPCIKRMQSG